ncbi:MAG: DUF2791 family P-loop domain-containing protein [Candidatus Cloacimonetes bacterium]|nr:DUF2791 family P-loop domain-containing protein [Candidatus Cloacimonadota bacterium]
MNNKQNSRNSIDPAVARRIIEIVGGQGTPPEYGFQYFTAGLDMYLKTIDEEYLKTFIKDGGSAFKMVVGIYGGGKTHYLYCIREQAWTYNYITSYITLSSQQSPFHKLEQVYKEIVLNLIYSQTPEELLSGYDRGIEAVIKKWYNEKYQELCKKLSSEDEILKELNTYASSLGPYESTSFRNAIKESFIALSENHEGDFILIMQWLKGENPPKNMLKNFRIFEKINKSTAFKMIRSLVQWIRGIGYSGIVVLMDEAEQTPSMSSKQKGFLLNNLRELIDECGHSNFKNTMWFYAVPDENFLEGHSQIYEALRQRVSTKFDTEINPTGVTIYLEKIQIKPVELLKEIGRKLAKIYEKAYNVKFSKSSVEETIGNIAKAAYEEKFAIGYKRLFVQNIIKAFHTLRKTEKVVTREDIDM